MFQLLLMLIIAAVLMVPKQPRSGSYQPGRQRGRHRHACITPPKAPRR